MLAVPLVPTIVPEPPAGTGTEPIPPIPPPKGPPPLPLFGLPGIVSNDAPNLPPPPPALPTGEPVIEDVVPTPQIPEDPSNVFVTAGAEPPAPPPPPETPLHEGYGDPPLPALP